MKYTLYLGGGAMAAIFGAGFLKVLEDNNFYKHINAVYSTSAGVLIAAYFICRESDKGHQVFWKDVQKGFVKPSNTPIAIIQSFWNRFVKRIPPEKFRNVLDISYMDHIIFNKRAINVPVLQKSKIPLFAKFLDTKTGKIGYYDVRFKTKKRIKESISVIPYYYNSDLRYVDGGIVEPLGIKTLLGKVRGKLVVVLNRTPKPSSNLRYFFKDLFEGSVAALMYGLSLSRIFRGRVKRFREEISIARSSDRVYLVTSPKSSPSLQYTQDINKLRTSYNMGRAAAKKFLSDVKNNNF